MPNYSIKVKWGKVLFQRVEVNTDEDPLLFKAQLYALTGVQPERQKVMLRGTTLKDDTWDNIKLKDDITILMMGSKEDVPEEPLNKPKFIEDMDEIEVASALNLPGGLVNLGNTCYLNSTVQCLRTVPELRDVLKEFQGSLSIDSDSSITPAHNITVALRDLFIEMERGYSLPPIVLVQMIHLAFPRFAEKSNTGGYQQQDANECWTEILRLLQEKLPAKDVEPNASFKPKSLIMQYFGGNFETELICDESDAEQRTKSMEEYLQLSCFIENDTRNIFAGIKNKMNEKITKFSSILGRDASYTKKSRINRLPAYLSIQFVRFQYKGKSAVNAKILKDVKFPFDFDAFELCTEELQKNLVPMREKFRILEELKIENSNPDLKKNLISSAEEMKKHPYWFPNDPGSNNSGLYTLQAVLTHQGRTSNSGHYVAWIRQSHDTWLKCDDENISVVLNESILKLSGGGEWHCAYVLLYGPRIFEVSRDNLNQFTN